VNGSCVRSEVSVLTLMSITMVDTGPSPARVSAEMASKEDETDGRYILSVDSELIAGCGVL